ncbi:MAG: hypothetical protein L3J82_02400 [Planctomycetes bacterium]|nr:hypothetical protein [Planctomycetota bacterium]
MRHTRKFGVLTLILSLAMLLGGCGRPVVDVDTSSPEATGKTWAEGFSKGNKVAVRACLSKDDKIYIDNELRRNKASEMKAEEAEYLSTSKKTADGVEYNLIQVNMVGKKTTYALIKEDGNWVISFEASKKYLKSIAPTKTEDKATKSE